MSCSSEPRAKWHTVVIPLNSDNTMHVTGITFTVFKLEKSFNTVNISGNSVNINIDCLASNDRLEYNWLPKSSHYLNPIID